MSNSDRDFILALLAVVLLGLVGLLVLLQSWDAIQRAKRLAKTGLEATGEIVDTKCRFLYSAIPGVPVRIPTLPFYVPMVAYRTARGEARTGVAQHYRLRRPTIGTQVPIRYDPAEPDEVQITGGPWRGADARKDVIGVIVLGVVVVATIIFLVVSRGHTGCGPDSWFGADEC